MPEVGLLISLARGNTSVCLNLAVAYDFTTISFNNNPRGNGLASRSKPHRPARRFRGIRVCYGGTTNRRRDVRDAECDVPARRGRLAFDATVGMQDAEEDGIERA